LTSDLRQLNIKIIVNHHSEAYSYDPVGNRNTGPKSTDGYAYNSGNELLNSTSYPNKGNTYEYDLNGNIIKKTETTQGNAKLITSYTYDDENRLIYVIIQKGNKTKEISYAYDPFGRRISKTIEKDELNDDNSTKKTDYPLTTFYIYDNQNIIAEYDQNNTQTASYIYGPNIDEPLSAEIKNTRIYYHADGLGTITSLTNHMGITVQKYDYDSFGNIKFTPFPHWIKQPYTYTGREFDTETGLYYYRARYYDPKVGRFVTKDPIGFKGGINVFDYVLNNPVNRTDPEGLYPGPCGNESNKWVPDYPFGFDFTKPCIAHDECYGCAGALAGKSRAMCDLEFFWNMTKKCFSSILFTNQCMKAAMIYFVAVRSGASDAFENGRICCK
jgi:RHS repeat-associated protein